MAKELGQSLIEVIFAVSIVGLILTGFVAAMLQFSKTGQVSESGSRAAQFAQEKIEELRSEKKTNPVQFWDNMAAWSAAAPASEAVGGGKFDRSINVDYDATNPNRRAKVEVSVDWREQDQQKNVTVSSYFSEY